MCYGNSRWSPAKTSKEGAWKIAAHTHLPILLIWGSEQSILIFLKHFCCFSQAAKGITFSELKIIYTPLGRDSSSVYDDTLASCQSLETCEMVVKWWPMVKEYASACPSKGNASPTPTSGFLNCQRLVIKELSCSSWFFICFLEP